MAEATYNPAVFSVPDLRAARDIILTPTQDASTEERWRKETPYLAELAARELDVSPQSLVLDYGCGVGRLSSALIRLSGCFVLGVDISAEMRALALSEEPSPRFSALSRSLLERLVASGFRASSALAVWSLQHIPFVEDDIALIRNALGPDGRLLVVNTAHRAIPTDAGWADDGKDIRALLSARLDEVHRGTLDPAAVGPATSERAFWAVYRRPRAL